MQTSVNDSLSAELKRRIKSLSKQYPNIEGDLARLYEDIASFGHSKVPNAHSVPNYSNTVWKYRCDSRDMKRGNSGGFRVLAYYGQEEQTLYPFFVYTKAEYEKAPKQQPGDKDIRNCIKQLIISLKEQHFKAGS